MKIAVLSFGDYLKDGRVQRTAEAFSEKYEVKVFVITEFINKYHSVNHVGNIRLLSKSNFVRV